MSEKIEYTWQQDGRTDQELVHNLFRSLARFCTGELPVEVEESEGWCACTILQSTEYNATRVSIRFRAITYDGCGNDASSNG